PLARLVHHATSAGVGDAVLRYAPGAAEQAAAHGAHREAAELYAVALEHAKDVPPVDRASLLEARAYRCYLIDRMEDAVVARGEAPDIGRAIGDRDAEANTLRWLPRLHWFLGDNAIAERYADDAIALLETLPRRLSLAWAYSNRAHLDM